MLPYREPPTVAKFLITLVFAVFIGWLLFLVTTQLLPARLP